MTRLNRSARGIVTVAVLLVGTLITPVGGTAPPPPLDAPLVEATIVFNGAAAGTWRPGDDCVGICDPFPAAGSLTLAITYNCDGIEGHTCGAWLFVGDGAAFCNWEDNDWGSGAIFNPVTGNDLDIECRGVQILGLICEAQASTNPRPGEPRLSLVSIAGVCTAQ